jgi:hypothetical protein
MPFQCRPTTVADEPALIALLTRVFAVDSQAPFVNPALLRWKYWEPRADYTEPRSFVMEQSGRIVAHIGLWPVTVQGEATTDRGVHLIDWAADPDASGSGVFMLHRMVPRFDFLYAIGGSDITRSILPKLGFRPVADAQLWARPLRPWRQMRNHQQVDLRLPVRFVRNLWWSQSPQKTLDSSWSAEEVSGIDNGLARFSVERTPSFFQYVQRCPAAQFRAFRVLHNGRPAGFFMLSLVWEQARVAGAWLEDDSPSAWDAVFRLAQDCVRTLTSASEFVARCSRESSKLGAQKAGLRLRARIPIFVFRKGGNTEPVQLPFHFLDNDAVFLGGQASGFIT